jgi:hypothetical protein
MPTAREAYLHRARKRRKSAADMSKFDSVTASPTTLPYVFPANARIAVSFSANIAAGILNVTAGGRTRKTPALAANEVYKLDVVDRAHSLDITSVTLGTVKLYVLDEWSRLRHIASKTFA